VSGYSIKLRRDGLEAALQALAETFEAFVDTIELTVELLAQWRELFVKELIE
jgi:hypothetical protein